MALSPELLSRFREWLKAAEQAGEDEPTAMTLATCDAQSGVSARIVLLKDVTEAGFVFYTNFESFKGRQLLADPRAALVFHWKTLERQVRIEGQVAPVADEEADAYFASRARGSQLGAWASEQSRPMAGRATLVKRVAATEAKYFGGAVPRPPHWSGFRLVPEMIEFWQGRMSRLHDRERHVFSDGEWSGERLFP